MYDNRLLYRIGRFIGLLLFISLLIAALGIIFGIFLLLVVYIPQLISLIFL